MARYKLLIEYDGTDFSGWQKQHGYRTVEGEIEAAFSKIMQQPVDVMGQGRTDAGVHARGQTAHVDLPDMETGIKTLIRGVNGLIGQEIRILDMEKTADDFHARFDARSRTYSYTILKRPSPLLRRHAWELPETRTVDTSIFYTCAAVLRGEFDFAGFSKYNAANYTTLCTVLHSEIQEDAQKLVYIITANRFLRNMVRRLAGTMAKAAEGKLSPEEFEEALRNPASGIQTFTAPARGLVLEEVTY